MPTIQQTDLMERPGQDINLQHLKEFLTSAFMQFRLNSAEFDLLADAVYQHEQKVAPR